MFRWISCTRTFFLHIYSSNLLVLLQSPDRGTAAVGAPTSHNYTVYNKFSHVSYHHRPLLYTHSPHRLPLNRQCRTTANKSDLFLPSHPLPLSLLTQFQPLLLDLDNDCYQHQLQLRSNSMILLGLVFLTTDLFPFLLVLTPFVQPAQHLCMHTLSSDTVIAGFGV